MEEHGLIKTEYINDLYGLRAGLSVISQEKDKAKEIQEFANDACKDIEWEFFIYAGMGNIGNIEFCGYQDPSERYGDNNHKTNGHYNLMADFGEAAECKRLQEGVTYWEKQHREKLNAEKNSLGYRLEKYEEKLKTKNQTVDDIVRECRRRYIDDRRKATMYTIFAVLLVPIVAFLLWVFIGSFFEGTVMRSIAFKLGDILPLGEVIVQLGFPIGAVAGIIGFGICVYRAHDYRPYGSFENAGVQESKEERELCNTIQQEIKSTKKEIQGKDAELREYESKAQWGIQNAAQYAKRIAETVQSRHLEIMKIKGEVDGVYMVLREQFAKELDERDWQHIDLIIYYYETGRAFTKQEALQLTDREVQTDRIVKSIGIATKYICGAIQSGFSQLSRQLNTISDSLFRISAHMGNISDELNEIRNIQKDHLNESEKQTAVMNEYSVQIQELVRAENLSNALQEKANQSSQQLMEDVRFFRDYMG